MFKSFLLFSLLLPTAVFSALLPSNNIQQLAVHRADGLTSSVGSGDPSVPAGTRLLGPEHNVPRAPRSSTRKTKPITNAQRFARGLPPAKPQRLYDPVRRQAAPSSTPSVAGIIQVNDAAANTFVGYVADFSFTGQGVYSLTTDETQALQITVPVGFPGSNIVSTNGPSAYPYLGAVTATGTNSLQISSTTFDYAVITGIANPTAPNAEPQSEDNWWSHTTEQYQPESCQTAIWNVDPNTFAITFQVVDSDGTKPQAYILHDTSTDAFFITGDPAAFDSALDANDEIVTFQFVQA